MNIENCKCGAVAEVWSSYCTGTGMGHGHVARCKNEHYGPWAKTTKGAIRTWNQFQRSELTLQQTILARDIGYTFQKAIARFSIPVKGNTAVKEQEHDNENHRSK